MFDAQSVFSGFGEWSALGGTRQQSSARNTAARTCCLAKIVPAERKPERGASGSSERCQRIQCSDHCRGGAVTCDWHKILVSVDEGERTVADNLLRQHMLCTLVGQQDLAPPPVVNNGRRQMPRFLVHNGDVPCWLTEQDIKHTLHVHATRMPALVLRFRQAWHGMVCSPQNR